MTQTEAEPEIPPVLLVSGDDGVLDWRKLELRRAKLVLVGDIVNVVWMDEEEKLK